MTDSQAVAQVATPTSSTSGNAKRKTPASGKKKEKTSKPKAKPSHPPTSQMVTSAISDLKEKGGSSLQAIKKYIGANYDVDSDKLAPFIRKYIKSAVEAGSLTQTKGVGASGSFKLKAPGESKSKPVGQVVKKKPVTKRSPKKATTVKTKKISAPAVNKKEPTVAKAKKTKTPPTKPKAPKVKKSSGKATTAAKSPKKSAPATSVAPKRKPPTKRVTPKKK